jgi:hypothetical protein
VTCSECRETCGYKQYYFCNIAVSDFSRFKKTCQSLCFNIAGSYKGTKSHRGRDAASSGISQGSISDMVPVVNTVPPTGDVSVSGHYQEEHGKYKVVLNCEMLFDMVRSSKVNFVLFSRYGYILLCSIILIRKHKVKRSVRAPLHVFLNLIHLLFIY